MSKYQTVTTMHENGYKLYGEKMIRSFLQNWPTDQKLVVYTEEFDLAVDLVNNPRIIVRNLLKCSPGLVAFKQQYANNPAANGLIDPQQKEPNFAFDAVRFSHKVYALHHAVHNSESGCSAIIWQDADTVTHAPVPVDFLERNFPLDPAVGIYYLGRTQQHSECGWMVFNLLNSHVKDFWKFFIEQYDRSQLFALDEWHDSFVFDHVRTTFEAQGMINSNITSGYVKGHPFIHSFLGEYMDHLKGPKRKAAGRSTSHEVRNHKSTWWQK